MGTRDKLWGSGIYHLLIYLSRERTIKIGSLGRLRFARGYYGYTGSAVSGYAGRIGRHLAREKKLRWHIDYLLRRGRVREVWLADGGECSRHARLGRGAAAVRGFGCSDCACESHLWQYARRPAAPRGWRVVKG